MKPILKNLPESPGCYLFLDKENNVIYIGKAKNLKKRVSSYFLKKDLDGKTKALVSNIEKIDFILTNTEVEALLLENNLIKKNKPKYNINLKDSKSFAYIEITNELYPQLIISRSEKIKNDIQKREIYGPFTSRDSRNNILEVLNKTFKLRTCKKLPKKKCIRFDMGICSAPCINEITKKEYLESLEKAKLVLKGDIKKLILRLKEEMKQYSSKKEFEKALLIREQIFSLESLNQKQNVERNKIYDEDIINFVKKEEKIYLMVFNINKGILENKKEFVFDYCKSFFDEFLIQYYSENKIPNKIILPIGVDESIEEYLNNLKKSKVEIIIPKKGELKELMLLVKKNIEYEFFQNLEKLEKLKYELHLKENPSVIECFDISHLNGTEVVGSMVQFRNGQPDKSNYRKFKIKGGDKNDDFAAMAEIIMRRYSKLKKENLDFPNLIVVDGGLGQLNASIKSLNKIGIKIPIVSLAKKFEEIFLPDGNILKLDEKNKARKFLEEIRDEAHRFAIKYQRERRHKNYFY